MRSDRRDAPTDSDPYSREAVKEFVLRRLRLTPSTLGEGPGDVPSVVRAVGGLQYGGHMLELFSRFRDFEPEWFYRWYENHALIEGHVLRGALRIVNAYDYPYYFKATRGVARRRRYQNCPESLSEAHYLALKLIDDCGPVTSQGFKELYREMHSERSDRAGRLLQDLYNYGEVARMGRRKQKPLYHTVGKLPYELDMSVGEEEAKEWLLLKCLSIYGPFTEGDIAHWAGWSLTETKETLRGLIEKDEIVMAMIDGDREAHYLRAEDLPSLESLENDLPEHTFVRVLFNDDALLLGYLPRLREYFGYDWRYPQLSDGVVWRAGIIYGREMAGEAEVEMYSKSKSFRVRSLTLRKDFEDPDKLSRIEEEFMRHASFQGKTLEMGGVKFV